jgi:hypothetical protein
MEQRAAARWYAIPHYHSILGIFPIFSGDRLWLGFEYLFCVRTVKGPRRIPGNNGQAREESGEMNFQASWEEGKRRRR